jgi:hypothetical protein
LSSISKTIATTVVGTTTTATTTATAAATTAGSAIGASLRSFFGGQATAAGAMTGNSTNAEFVRYYMDAAAKSKIAPPAIQTVGLWGRITSAVSSGFHYLGGFLGSLKGLGGSILSGVARLGGVVAVAYTVVGSAAKIYEWLTGDDIGGFFGPLEAIKNMFQGVYDKYIGKPKDDIKKPEIINPVKEKEFLEKMFRTASPEDALKHLQNIYTQQYNEVTEKERIARSNPEDEIAQIEHENAIAKLSGISRATASLFGGTTIGSTYDMNDQQRAELFNKNSGNFQPNYQPS